MKDTIIELLDRRPFTPFRIVLTSDERIDVTDPHLSAMGPSTIFYCYSHSDRFAWLRQNQIAHIETLEQAA